MDPIILTAQEVHIPDQKYFESVGHFPYVFGSSDTTVSIREAVDWVKFNKKHIESILLKHGAILFRGFPTNDAVAFNEFILAFGYENLPYIGGAAPRKQIVGDVFSANEAPPEANIPFHHEMATVKNWPKKLFFYGDVCPEVGGQTPILLSNEVYKRMVAKHPAFMEKLERLGLKYTRILPEENDETSPQGRGWKATYGVTTKEQLLVKLEERKLDYEWLPNGELRTVNREALSGVEVDVRTGLKMFFNSIVAIYTGWNDSRHVGEKCVHFGDGSPLEKDVVFSCRDIMDEICVNHKWQHGDVIMIDNRVAMHARRPFVGQRKIYAYLTQT